MPPVAGRRFRIRRWRSAYRVSRGVMTKKKAKRGRGRPPTGRRSLPAARLLKDEYAAFLSAVDSLGVSKSAFIREALRREVRRIHRALRHR